MELPCNSYYERQWHLHSRLDHSLFDRRASTNTEEAWLSLQSMGERRAVVAIADDGCRLDHPSFSSDGKFAGWAYFDNSELITNKSSSSSPSRMFVGGLHGTSCCGLVAANVHPTLPVGVAPECRLLPIRWEMRANLAPCITEVLFLKTLDFIADKADVAVCTWSQIPVFEWSSEVLTRIRQLELSGGNRGKGILFIWAAGNSNCPINLEVADPIPYRGAFRERDDVISWHASHSTRSFRNCFVDRPNTMHVAAISSSARKAHYSCYGPGITVCAPSNNTNAYTSEILGLGLTTITGRGSDVTNNFKGTSGAAAIAGGVAALVIAANPTLTAPEVKKLMIQGASRDLNFEKYDTQATLLPSERDGEFNNAGWSPWFGFGKLDASMAVTLTLATRAHPHL